MHGWSKRKHKAADKHRLRIAKENADKHVPAANNCILFYERARDWRAVDRNYPGYCPACPHH